MAHQNDYIKTTLRLPRQLHADLHQSAQQMGRSLNADIISRLIGSEKPTEGIVTVDPTEKMTVSPEWFDFLKSLSFRGGDSGCLPNGDTSNVRNCAETQPVGLAYALELHAHIYRLQEELINKGQRLSFMFDMHQEFMQRYEDLVQDRDRWMVLAECWKALAEPGK